MALMVGNGPVDDLKIRGKAIEALAVIASSISKKTFMPYSENIINALLQLEASNLPEDDPRLPLLHRSWGKFAKALGKDFAPILPPILPRIIRSASLEADVKILSPEQQEDEGWQLLELDQQNVLGINTAVTQEKTAAMTLLYWLAFELQELMFPHIPQILPLCINGIEFFYHDAVRTAAFSIIPCLVRATKDTLGRDHPDLQKILLFSFPHLMSAINNEITTEVLLVMLDALDEVNTITNLTYVKKNKKTN